MALNSRLPEFMQVAAATLFEWGWFDCSLWLANWYAFATGAPDPAARLRRTYRSAEECSALFGRVPALRMVRKITSDIGLGRTADPMSGDIAVIAVRCAVGRVCVGSIRTQRGWATLSETKGISMLPPEAVRQLAAWRLPECLN